MGSLIDITGKKFNRLTVIKRSHTDSDNFIVWECVCDCGKKILARAYPLKNGAIKSCGCLNNELRSQRVKTHGLSKLPIYMVWKSMKARCYRKTDKRYDRYGGRGIAVCAEWINSPEVFIKWALQNGYKLGLSIDREKNDLGYSPNNCRFLSKAKNNQNSSNTKMTDKTISELRELTHSGLRQIDLAEKFGITQQTVSKILNNKTWKNE